MSSAVVSGCSRARISQPALLLVRNNSSSSSSSGSPNQNTPTHSPRQPYSRSPSQHQHGQQAQQQRPGPRQWSDQRSPNTHHPSSAAPRWSQPAQNRANSYGNNYSNNNNNNYNNGQRYDRPRPTPNDGSSQSSQPFRQQGQYQDRTQYQNRQQDQLQQQQRQQQQQRFQQLPPHRQHEQQPPPVIRRRGPPVASALIHNDRPAPPPPSSSSPAAADTIIDPDIDPADVGPDSDGGPGGKGQPRRARRSLSSSTTTGTGSDPTNPSSTSGTQPSLNRDKERFRRSRLLGSEEDPPAAPGGGGGSGSGGKNRAARATVAAAIGTMGRFRGQQRAPPPPPVKKQKTSVFLPSYLTVSNLARVLGVKLWDLQVRMRNMGHDDIRPDLTLSFSDAELIAAEFNLLAIANDEAAFDIYPRPPLSTLALTVEKEGKEGTILPLRPPVVTIMGHVDHGKTTLLDKLRSTSVAAGEAGGITQHIGAFSVPVRSSSSEGGLQSVTFLDTPGHAAFTAMRSRGASVTDMVVLVVAADDGVMPQTREVIELWKELSAREAQFDPAASSSPSSSSTTTAEDKKGGGAGGGRRLGSGAVQLVVALSKSDKPTADPEKVKRQLLSEGIELEEFGGEVPCVPVSGKTGDGLELLQDTLVTLAELAELRAEQSGPVEGYVIESKVEKGRGNVATVLVKRGALRVGDVGVAGTTWLKVRSMTDSAGKTLRELRPGQAGVVTGWKEVPCAGDEMLGAGGESAGGGGGESAAKRAIENRKRRVEAAKLGEDVAQINEARRVVAEEAERKKRADFVERQQRRLAEAALAAGKSVEQLLRENKLSSRGGGAMDAFLDREERGEHKEGAGEEEAEEGEEGEESTKKKKKELLVIVKADVSGSAEAVIGAISGIGNKEAGVRIVSSGVGEPTEGDLAMARAVGARIIAFNVPIPRAIERAASSYSPPIPLHSSPIIYRLMEYVSESVASLLPPLRQIRVTGEATVAQIFKINLRSRVFTKVAGCRVLNGTIARSSEVRLLRREGGKDKGKGKGKGKGQDEDDEEYDDESPHKKDKDGGQRDDSAGLSVGADAGGGRKVVWIGKLDSLKHGKNEVPDRGKGTECGMSFEGFQGFEEGDVVQCFYTVELPRQLM
ncbi:hypothetical protein A4X06_0g7487 [Tilletia controversa]|uniref:Tr-type G domain-containing protein n=3 Tax=Tilletia TaxID=13289 RepID=A0A8X7MM70_9BASI|nr:hypothetical protein CF336_g7034 [Tilletia laevis]KAE8188361.1 hypothetical protein CF328_g6624 [Tilletia controversa]KAE8241572.1 hypothetical protein A4X06_0g7487 [Tilletia controversa]KAE8250441.1 hypothetical protein A4X03_0g6436 [Tilletia caries]